MSAEVAANLDSKADAVGTCALRRYITRKGTLIASYNWHDAENFHYRMKMSRTI